MNLYASHIQLFKSDSNSKNNNPIHIQHFMSDSNSKNNNSQGFVGFQKFMNGYKGMCISRGKFLKPWQVTDKITE